MKTWSDVTRKEMVTLIIIGVILSTISFLYYFLLGNPIKEVLYVLCAIDLILFFINAYNMALIEQKNRITTIIIALLIMIAFFAFFELVVLCASNNTFTFDMNLFLNVLLVGIFLSPSIIILLPVIYLVAQGLG